MRPTLLFMKKSELLEKFIFCFSRIFWYDEWNFQFDKNTGHYAIMLWSLHSLLIFPQFLILNSFGNSSGNSYLPCLQVIIAHSSTYYEIKIWWNINMSQDIVKMIAKFSFMLYVFIKSKTFQKTVVFRPEYTLYF